MLGIDSSHVRRQSRPAHAPIPTRISGRDPRAQLEMADFTVMAVDGVGFEDF
jgi:hypothetical protein